MGDLLGVILPVFLVLGAGYFAVKRELFSESGVEGLMKFTQSFAIPCLLFRAIAELDLGTYFTPSVLIAYFVPAISMFFLAMVLSRAFFGRPWQDNAAIGFACLYSNTVLLGLPIIERAYGEEALDPLYSIFALNAPICYFLGIVTMETIRNQGGNLGKTLLVIAKAIFGNALVVGLMLGFAVNLTGVTLPQVIMDAVDMMIEAALPAAIFGLGGVLAQYKLEGDLGPVLLICALSLILQPLASWVLASLGGLDQKAFRAVVLTSAMAPGINTYVFANIYGVAKRVAASAVLVTTALSILTTWGWLSLLP